MNEQVSFGPFRLDLGRRVLLRDGSPVPLGGRAVDLLCVLAAAKGELVTKDAVMASVWPGRIVDESTIQAQVSALRRALQNGASAPSLHRHRIWAGLPFRRSRRGAKRARRAGQLAPALHNSDWARS